MRYVMYTEKTVPQAMNAINERLHTAGTKSRPQLDGWVEKSGRFSMQINASVKWRLMRKTVLQGRAEKLGNITLIQGTVPGGVGTPGMLVIVGALAAVAFIVYSQGNALLAATAIIAALVLYVPLTGDFQNCETLLSELQKSLNAKFTPPNNSTKSTSTASSAPRTATPARKPAARVTSAKPASKATTAKTSGAKPARKPAAKSTSTTTRKKTVA